MIEYIGNGELRYFEILLEFAWSSCKFRHNDLKTADDYDNNVYSIDLKAGDIISVKYYKLDSSGSEYAYLEDITSDEGVIIYEEESIISKGFILKNTILFLDITKKIERDKIIDILCQEKK